jgi:spermidine synthase
MRLLQRQLLFLLFFLSGFSSLVYQVVWTRMAFANFGIIAPVLSVVISVFMLGLALGSWLGGRSVDALTTKTRSSAIVYYMLIELVIGLGAFAVPILFAASGEVLLSAGQMDSFRYLSLSALLLAFSILPWCVCMGATFPFMMAYVREQDPQNTESFSFLYLANVLGAMSGTLVTAFVLVEFFGFQQTLCIAAAGNFTIAAISGCLARKQRKSAVLNFAEAKVSSPPLSTPPTDTFRRPFRKWILFSTGFTAMAMEVVWTRAFTPVLKTQVYSFALIIFAYLGATFCGSLLYRRGLRTSSVWNVAKLMSVAVIATFLPILFNDLRFLGMAARFSTYLDVAVLLFSIAPLCAVLGYLTPSLIDKDALGDPADAGNAYAVNVLGCILGPLFASYILLPWFGERYGLVLLSLPFLGFYFFTCRSLPSWYRAVNGVMAGTVLIWSLFCPVDFGNWILKRGCATEIRRDYAASVISAGDKLDKHLFVNGIGVTSLTPETKFMAHLPLALHAGKPESMLIICFGMGTTYRSALSWDIDTTAVELVPSVKNAFGFYHQDAARILNNPKGRIIIDDGRRFLKRTSKMFDVVVTDPPPPIEAAGSSLLYSEEFYELVKQHLKPNGIIQVWFPGGELRTTQAVFRSLENSFPHVRCFRGVEGVGYHMLASMQPIEPRTPEEIASAMPAAAKRDLLEWNPSAKVPAYLGQVLLPRFPIQLLLNGDPEIRITDDQPYNEYFFLRRSRLF